MNLDNYAPVADRIAAYWRDNPDGRIATELLIDDGTRVLMRASVYRRADDPLPVAEGLAEEIRGSSNVNRTSAVENCETSAIGRALANWIYQASTERPSREEMGKVARMTPQEGAGSPQPATPSRLGPEPATDAQKRKLRALGYAGPVPASKRETSALIDRLVVEATGGEDPF